MKPRQKTSPAVLLVFLALFIAFAVWTNTTSHAQGQVQVNAADPMAA